MTHCGEKWVNMVEKHPEICEMSESYRRRVDYWIGLCDQIISRGFDRNLVFKHFPEAAAREIKKCGSDAAREKALNYICDQLKRGEKVTAPDLKEAIRMYEERENPTSCSVVKSRTIGNTSTPDHEVKNPEPAVEEPAKTLADRVRADEMRAAEANQAHVNPGAKVTINPVIINDTHRQSPFKTGSQVRAGIAGEMYPQQQEPADPPAWTPEVCKSGKCPNGDSYYAPKRGECALCGDPIDKITLCPLLERRKQQVPSRATADPQTITIHCNDKRWAVLKQVQREGQADSFEDAVLWLIDEAGDRMERE